MRPAVQGVRTLRAADQDSELEELNVGTLTIIRMSFGLLYNPTIAGNPKNNVGNYLGRAYGLFAMVPGWGSDTDTALHCTSFGLRVSDLSNFATVLFKATITGEATCNISKIPNPETERPWIPLHRHILGRDVETCSLDNDQYEGSP